MRNCVRSLCIGVLLYLLAASPTRAEQPGLTPAPEGSFTVIVIPDTQNYRGDGARVPPKTTGPVTNPNFERQTQWIADNLKAQRVVFVSHSGDIVDRNTPEQWAVALRCIDRLHGKIAYGLAVGNHDMTGEGDSSLFQKHFPASRFAGFDWYGGSFKPDRPSPAISGNNADSWQTFSAEGLDFIILHLECNAPDDVLAWADDVLTKHSNRRAMITTHMDLGPLKQPQKGADFFKAPKGRMQWKKSHGTLGNTPQQLWDKCYRKHKNLFAIFSGDQSRTTARYLKSTGDHGNTVHEFMSDYRWVCILRLYRFLPKHNQIQVITCDTQSNALVDRTDFVPDRTSHQFTVDYPMSK